MKIQDITCVSDLYYIIGHWFTLFMVAIAFVFLPVSLEIWPSVFSFAMCAGLGFVGVAAEYRDKTVYPVHMGAACVSALCSVLWTIHVCPWALCSFAVAALGLIDRTRWFMWLEVPCFIMVDVGIIYSLV